MNLFHSATVKLTIWYVALVMLISLCFSGIVYHFAARELANSLNTQTQRIYKNFPILNNDPIFKQHGELATGEAHIIRSLIYFNILVLVGSGFASYLLAKRTLRPIEEVLEQQKRFTADVSHELRTPLTALKMESEVMLADKSAGKKDLRATIASNVEEANKLETLITTLLRLSKLESAELQQSFEPVQVTDIVTAAVNEVNLKAEQKQLKIVQEVSTATTMGDLASLVQLVVILLDNAIKYSSRGTTITVTGTRDQHHYKFSIKDRGSGIATEDLKHVFDRFYRADSSRNKNGNEGYGLGLSIAKQIADLHHATITLASKPGKGTLATVSLPLEQLGQ